MHTVTVHIKWQVDILTRVLKQKFANRPQKISRKRTFTSDLQTSVLTETLTAWYSSVTCAKSREWSFYYNNPPKPKIKTMSGDP